MANTERYRSPRPQQPRTMRVRLAMEIDASDWQVLRNVDIDRLMARQHTRKASELWKSIALDEIALATTTQETGAQPPLV